MYSWPVTRFVKGMSFFVWECDVGGCWVVCCCLLFSLTWYNNAHQVEEGRTKRRGFSAGNTPAAVLRLAGRLFHSARWHPAAKGLYVCYVPISQPPMAGLLAESWRTCKACLYAEHVFANIYLIHMYLFVYGSECNVLCSVALPTTALITQLISWS